MELSSADRKVIFDKLAAMRREVAHLSGEILRLETAVRVKDESKIVEEMDSMSPRIASLQQLRDPIFEILDAALKGPLPTSGGRRRLTNTRVVNLRL
jgi:hypothetical protein